MTQPKIKLLKQSLEVVEDCILKLESILDQKNKLIASLEEELRKEKTLGATSEHYESKYFQMHWQYIGTNKTTPQATLDISKSENRTEAINNFVDKISKHYPCPEGVIWMFCNEKSDSFVDP